MCNTAARRDDTVLRCPNTGVTRRVMEATTFAYNTGEANSRLMHSVLIPALIKDVENSPQKGSFKKKKSNLTQQKDGRVI